MFFIICIGNAGERYGRLVRGFHRLSSFRWCNVFVTPMHSPGNVWLLLIPPHVMASPFKAASETGHLRGRLPPAASPAYAGVNNGDQPTKKGRQEKNAPEHGERAVRDTLPVKIPMSEFWALKLSGSVLGSSSAFPPRCERRRLKPTRTQTAATRYQKGRD